MTFDNEVWLWTFVKAKKVYFIRCHLLCFTLVTSMMSMCLILYKIWLFIYLLYVTFDLHPWPSASVKITCTLILRSILCCWMLGLLPKMKIVGTFVWRKLEWRHNDVITPLIFMKFKCKSTKGISKRHIEYTWSDTRELKSTEYY